MAKLKCKLSKEELLYIQTQRAEKATGYAVHKTPDGRFYIWAMGLQPANPRTGRTPKSAARKFLEDFEPRDIVAFGSMFHSPRKRKASKIVVDCVPAE